MGNDFLEMGRLIIDVPLSYQFIKEFHLDEEANEHGCLSLRLVSDKQLSEADILRLEDVPIQVYTPEGKTVFSGTCIMTGLVSENSYSEITLEARSWSYLSDVENRSKTFQDPGKSLGDVVHAVLGSYGYAVSLEEDIPVSIMLSQQEETDWHFIRRIANQFGYMVFADSKSKDKRISIGVVPFSEQALTPELNATMVEKDISAYWQAKNGAAAGASAYEFLKQGYQLADLTLGVGHGVSGGPCLQVVTKSRITASQGLLTNSVILTYQDGAYPVSEPAGGTAGVAESGQSNGASAQAPVQASNAAAEPSVVSGTVLAVAFRFSFLPGDPAVRAGFLMGVI